MKNFRYVVFGLIAAVLAAMGVAAPAAAQSSNPSNCTLAGCQQSWTQNGIQSFVRTYKYSSLGNTPAATPTDLFTISGAAGGKIIRITKIVVGGVAGTAGDLNPLIIRRSAVDTGGTSTNPVAQPRDTSNAAAAATLSLYTVNPAGLGTTVGTLDSCRLLLNLVTATPDVCAFTYGVNDDQLTVLRGATDVLAINFAGAAVPATGAVDIDVEWTEEP